MDILWTCVVLAGDVRDGVVITFSCGYHGANVGHVGGCHGVMGHHTPFHCNVLMFSSCLC